MSSSPSSPEPLHIAVLLPTPPALQAYTPTFQLLDLSPIDLFSMTTPQYLTSCSLPSPLIALSRPIKISYVSLFPYGSQITCTSHLKHTTTHTISDAAVAPGKVDIVFLPGPEPGYQPSGIESEWVKTHLDEGKTVMSICTAAFWCARIGIFEGRRVTGPRALVGELRKIEGRAEWVDRRWVVDEGSEKGRGVIWSAGGITNGQEMVAAYLRAKFPGPVAEAVCAMAEVGTKGQDYEETKVGMFGAFGWILAKAWFAGLWRKQKSD